MFEAVVDVTGGACTEVCALRRTRMHMHPNAVELLYVLRGGLHVTVSCETFDLEVGDFAVLNHSDPHLLEGSDDNVTAMIHFDPAAFRHLDPHVEQLCFACESFDLARYLQQESLLRGLILDLIDAAATRSDTYPTGEQLMRLLCDEYSLESYYHRDARITAGQREKFRAIFSSTRRHAHRRDVLDVVAAEHHYSKSYVSHVVKDTAAISFSDMLTYLRLANSERLLLTTDATVLDIATQCGFSDVKYFTRGFVDWFRQTPSEYRSRYRPEVLRDDESRPVDAATVQRLVGEHRQRVASPNDGPRLSVTPLLLKNIGSKVDLFERIRTRPHVDAMPPVESTGPRHLIPIQVDIADVDSGYLLDALASFAQINATPCLVLRYTSRMATIALVDTVAQRLRGAVETPMLWLVYHAAHDRPGVDCVIAHAADSHRMQVQAVLMM
jgi:AraC-like DNA-binding protein